MGFLFDKIITGSAKFGSRLQRLISLVGESQSCLGCLPQLTAKAYSFKHLLKSVELVGAEIPFFWHRSTENGKLRSLQISFTKAYSFAILSSVSSEGLLKHLQGFSENGRDPKARNHFLWKPILLVTLFSVDLGEIIDVFFWALLETVDFRCLGNPLFIKLVDFQHVAKTLFRGLRNLKNIRK